MTRRNNVAVFLLTCSLAFTLVCGCKKEVSSPPPQQAQPAKTAAPASAVHKSMTSTKSGVQKTISAARIATVGSIDFTSKKDPFKPAVTAPLPTDKNSEQVVKKSGDLLPILSYETEKFKVVGIITGIKENRALLIDPAGKAYVVRQGMAVGSNNGVVAKVNLNSVEIVEKFRNDDGRVRKRTVKLTLTRKK
ncbi:pilus assembly protein PilP [Geobacter argillaceus]|uniref:Type IV pilus assembly protein PilP n=1 Tax=Geobacter argillaceus TaxID=345631 RepID=A0A562WRA6_9BACT|nr:pilus assembly protein PilP [Geobacter argillaceus]TWJ32778.1 type IV pilus assembly protein PilP [Geobacter argillaceus]